MTDEHMLISRLFSYQPTKFVFDFNFSYTAQALEETSRTTCDEFPEMQMPVTNDNCTFSSSSSSSSLTVESGRQFAVVVAFAFVIVLPAVMRRSFWDICAQRTWSGNDTRFRSVIPEKITLTTIRNSENSGRTKTINN